MNIDDKKYWMNFYDTSSSYLKDCSSFCNFIINYFKDNNNINTVLDCGCGNGRDSFQLAKKYVVTGVDNSGFSIQNTENLNFQNENYVSYDKTDYDLIYSRFSFHSISNENQETFLSSIKNGSFLAIETRSNIDSDNIEYYGKSHYRNYTNANYLKDLLSKNNFDILYFYEGKDVAIFHNENPTCIRVICKKNS